MWYFCHLLSTYTRFVLAIWPYVHYFNMLTLYSMIMYFSLEAFYRYISNMSAVVVYRKNVYLLLIWNQMNKWIIIIICLSALCYNGKVYRNITTPIPINIHEYIASFIVLDGSIFMHKTGDCLFFINSSLWFIGQDDIKTGQSVIVLVERRCNCHHYYSMCLFMSIDIRR